MKYFDHEGKEVSEGEFRKIFGDFYVSLAMENSRYRVAELHDSGPQAGMDCQVYVKNGYGNGARLVIMNGGKAYGSVKSRDMQEVNFWAGYAVPGMGPYSIKIEDQNRKSDTLGGLGWLYETNHRHIQKVVFEISDEPTGNIPPEPRFIYYVAGKAVVVDASGSFDPDGQIVSYEWDMGDGVIYVDSSKIKSHVYGEYGIYTVILKVTDNDGLSMSSFEVINISNNSNLDAAYSLLEEATYLIDQAMDLIK